MHNSDSFVIVLLLLLFSRNLYSHNEHIAPSPLEIRVEWNAPSQCIPRAGFVTLVQDLLDESIVLSSEEKANLTFVGKISQHNDQWILVLKLLDTNAKELGTRTVTTKGDCRAFDKTIALVSALAIDSLKLELNAQNKPNKNTGTDATNESDNHSDTTAPDDSQSRADKNITTKDLSKKLSNKNIDDDQSSEISAFSIGIAAGGSYKYLPSMNYFASVYGSYQIRPKWTIGMHFSGWLPREKRLDSGLGGRFGALKCMLEVCRTISNARFRICAGAGVSFLHGKGLGLDRNESASAIGIVSKLDMGLMVRLGRLVLIPSAGVGFSPIVQHFTFQLGSTTEEFLFQPAYVYPLVSLKIQLALKKPARK